MSHRRRDHGLPHRGLVEGRIKTLTKVRLDLVKKKNNYAKVLNLPLLLAPFDDRRFNDPKAENRFYLLQFSSSQLSPPLRILYRQMLYSFPLILRCHLTICLNFCAITVSVPSQN